MKIKTDTEISARARYETIYPVKFFASVSAAIILGDMNAAGETNGRERLPRFSSMGSEGVVRWLHERVDPIPNGPLRKAVEKAVADIRDHHYEEAAELLGKRLKDAVEHGTRHSF